VVRHAHPGLVAVTAGPRDAAGHREFSTGQLIGPRLVLTSRHGVSVGEVSRPEIVVRPVVGPPGSVQLGDEVEGQRVWAGGDRLDAALVELAEDWEPPEDFVRRVRWGQLTGDREVAAWMTGMPRSAYVSSGITDTESVRGMVDPATYTFSDRFAVNVESWPEGAGQWAGMSGAALWAEAPGAGWFLIGVVAWTETSYTNKRLAGVRATAMFAEPGFCAVMRAHLGVVPSLVPVELATVVDPGTPPPIAALGDLLRAEAAIVSFTGRKEELGKLAGWRDDPADTPLGIDLSIRLITGHGGEGKTRLARHFIGESHAKEWAAGELRSMALSPGHLDAITASARPVLLLIDYAAARTGQLTSVIEHAFTVGIRSRLRLLLLARGAGSWWEDLINDQDLYDHLPELSHSHIALHSLVDTEQQRESMFRAAAAAFVPHLPQFTHRSEEELSVLAAAVRTPVMRASRYSQPLAIQLAALAALLEACTPLSSGAAPEKILLQHEKRHRDELAAKRGLNHLYETRDRAVGAAVLIGARGSDRAMARDMACAVVGRALGRMQEQHLEDRRKVARWIADIYPPPSEGGEPQLASGVARPVAYWGTVQPDRLAEFLIAAILADEPDLTQALAVGADPDPADAEAAMLVLSRITQHHPEARRHIDTLIMKNPPVFGTAALWACLYSEAPDPLRDALAQLGTQAPESFEDVVAAASGSVRGFSSSGIAKRVGLTAELTRLHRELIRHNRPAYLPKLAKWLDTHAIRLSEARRWTEAVTVSGEAVQLHQELVARDHDAYLPGLALSLTNHARHLTGQVKEAVTVSAEAVQLNRELAARDRDAYLPGLALSLINHAKQLAGTGQVKEAVTVSAEAVQLSRELAARDRDAYLPDLASSLINHATRLADTKRSEEALSASTEAVRFNRELTAINRDAYLPDLVESLIGQAYAFIGDGQFGNAVRPLTEALALGQEQPEPNQGTIESVSVLLRRAYESEPQAVSEEFLAVTGVAMPDIFKVSRASSENKNRPQH